MLVPKTVFGIRGRTGHHAVLPVAKVQGEDNARVMDQDMVDKHVKGKQRRMTGVLSRSAQHNQVDSEILISLSTLHCINVRNFIPINISKFV